jgi:MFS family permease
MKSNYTKTLIALATTHWMVDCFGGMWPIFKYLVNLDLERAGFIFAMAILIGSAVQPIFGILSDHGHRRRLIVWGTFLAGLGMLLGPASLLEPFVSQNTYYAVLFMVLLVQTFGASMYHPAAVSAAGDIRHDRRSTLVSVFIACGLSGMAISHGFFSMAFRHSGAHTEWLLIITLLLGLLGAAWCHPDVSRAKHSTTARWHMLKSIRTPLAILFVFQMVMSIMFHGFAFLMPEFLELRACPAWMIRGGGYFFYVVGGSAMMLLGGPLADRLGRSRLLAMFTAASIVFLFALILMPAQSWGVYALMLFLAGGFGAATIPMGVAIGQRLAPECVSTVSGILMGLAWAVASPAFWLIGILAERCGLIFALLWVGSLGVVGLLAALTFARYHARLQITS